MTAYYCADCLEVEVSPTARDGRCIECRPSRRHTEPRPKRRSWARPAEAREAGDHEWRVHRSLRGLAQ